MLFYVNTEINVLVIFPCHRIVFFNINTNEIPSELSRENMISSHLKRSLLLWLHVKIAPFNAFFEMI